MYIPTSEVEEAVEVLGFEGDISDFSRISLSVAKNLAKYKDKVLVTEIKEYFKKKNSDQLQLNFVEPDEA